MRRVCRDCCLTPSASLISRCANPTGARACLPRRKEATPVTATFRLGRLAGVDVGLHWSVLIIFGLLAWSLSASRFPVEYPGNPPWGYVVAGVGAAVVFLLGLLAHEVSHAVVAKRNGLAVEGITLWVFGGVARLQGEARSPGVDLRIAGVGPLVSLLIGAGFGAVAVVLAAAGKTGLGFGTFAWLARI